MSKKEKKPLHWAVRDLFEIAVDRGYNETRLEILIEEQTGKKISRNTLRYWHAGYSSPRVDEVDLIAKALGYEIDLILMEKE